MINPATETGSDDLAADTPYPSWTTVAGQVSMHPNSDDTECRTLREARIWQSFADEPMPQNDAAGGTTYDSNTVRR